MTVNKFKTLGKLEIQCTLCGKDLEANDIVNNNYIAVFKNRKFRMAHRKCYENYIIMVKGTKNK